MKKLLFLLVTLFVLISCEKSDQMDQIQQTPEVKAYAANYLNYGIKRYELDKMTMENYGNIAGTGLNFDIILLSPGLRVVEKYTKTGQMVMDSITGTGSGFYVELFAQNKEKLQGAYRFTKSRGDIGTFDYGNVIIEFNMLNHSGTDLDVASGYVIVWPLYSGEFLISIQVMLENGQRLLGYYKGGYKYYDYTGLKQAPLELKQKLYNLNKKRPQE